MAPKKRVSRSTRPRLWGAPEPANFKRTMMGRDLVASAKIHLKNSSDIDKLVAVEKLAIDVFCNAAAARAFSTNPQEYMAQAGFPNVKLDLNSEEVRLAMALGDPAVRQAASRGDAMEFARAVMQQGFADLKAGTLGGIIVAELIVHASAVCTAVAIAVTRVAVVSKAVAVVEVKVTGDGTILTRVAEQVEVLSRMAEELGNPGLAKSIRAPKIRKMLESYIRLQMKTA